VLRLNALRLQVKAHGEGVVLDRIAFMLLEPTKAISFSFDHTAAGLSVSAYRNVLGFIHNPDRYDVEYRTQIQIQKPVQIDNLLLLCKESRDNEPKKAAETEDQPITTLAGFPAELAEL